MRTFPPRLREAPAIALLGLLSIWAGQAPAQSTQASIDQLWHEASAEQQGKHYDRAAELYKKILTLQPDLIEAQVNLGLMEQLTGDMHAAISSFEQALTRSPSLYAPNLLAGLDYLKLDHPAEALPYLQRAVAAKPNSGEALVGLGNSHLQLHLFSAAEANFKDAIALNDGKNSDAWYGLGATYLSIEKEAEARLSHTSPFRSVLLGESYLEQGQRDRAILILKAVADASSTVPCAHALLGFAYLRNTEPDDAVQQFELDWNASQRSGCLLAQLGLVAVDAGRSDTARALDELQDAAKIDLTFVRKNSDYFLNAIGKPTNENRFRKILDQPDQPAVALAPSQSASQAWAQGHYTQCSSTLAAEHEPLNMHQLRLLSRCSYYIGEDQRVIDATGQQLKSDAADDEALYWRAQSAQRMGLEALARATTLNPESATLHVLSADMRRGKGDLSAAAEEYRKALTLKPDFLAAHLGLARDLNSDGKATAAEQELKYVLNANPNEPEANYLMGEILLNRNSYAAALPMLQRALLSNPDQLPFVHLDLSKVYEEQGDTQRAISELKQAVSVDEDGSYYYRLGRLYMKVGDRAAAAEALKRSAAMHEQADSSALFQK